jgi:ribonuclease HI
VTSNQKSETSLPSEAPRAKEGDQKPDASDWQRMRFKKNKVWMALDDQGQPVIKEGKVLIKYQLKQDYQYWVKKANVTGLETPVTETSYLSGKTHRRHEQASSQEPSLEDKICVFTDGASSGNPGPSGIGVVLRYGGHEKEISQFIGQATNNIAELKAIDAGLSALKNRHIPVRLFTDSKYAYGLLMLNWKPKKNRQLVESIKKKMAEFQDLKILKVKGHSGHPENEKADYLATSAIKKADQ